MICISKQEIREMHDWLRRSILDVITYPCYIHPTVHSYLNNITVTS